MRRRGDQRNARDGIACLGDNLINLEPRQLAALTGLSSLGYLDLNLLSVHQILGGHAKTSAGNLFGLTRQRHSVNLCVVA